jgi:putative ATP-dependent endonuclease of OLD family
VAQFVSVDSDSADGANPGPPEIDAREFASFYVERMVVRNYRGINEIEIEFEPDLTIIAGHNNVGKSRIVSALQLALGGRGADGDDFSVGGEEPPEIDIFIAPPTPPTSSEDGVFSDQVAQVFDRWVQTTSEEPAREKIAWRTRVLRSAEGFGALSETRMLTYDAGREMWIERVDALRLGRFQRSLVAVDLINTNRDLIDELSRRGSTIRRILSDLEVGEGERSSLENQLAALSRSIIEKSGTLSSVTAVLRELHSHIGTIGSPAVNALPINLEELARSISIDLDMGKGSIPMRMHGSGSRSLASLQVQGVLYDRRLGKDGIDIKPHPVTLVEEPEAHLHPQASLELASLLNQLRGQKVVTTHSAHLITAIEPRAIRIIRSDGDSIRVVDLGPVANGDDTVPRAFRPETHVAEWEKLKRQVERPFGELMFASAIILGDGATERAFLPIVIRHALGHLAHGVTVIDPGSLSKDLAIAAVKFAHLTGTPWLVFADSDASGREAVNTLRTHGDGDDSRIIWILIEDEHGTVLADATESMLVSFDDPMCRRACEAIRPDVIDSSKTTLQLLKGMKGTSGAALARELISSHPEYTSWPSPLVDLIQRLKEELHVD